LRGILVVIDYYNVSTKEAAMCIIGFRAEMAFPF
jgi:hypothetical protein